MCLFLPFCPDRVVALGDPGFALGDTGSELAVARNTRLAETGEGRDAQRGVAQGADRAGLHAAIVKSPFADIDLAKSDLDEIACGRCERLARAQRVVELGELLLP